MPDLKTARLMLKMARKDLNALGGMMDADTFAEEVFGFHAQQALEKALKSWLCVLTEEVPRTHDLEQIFGLLGEAGANVPSAFKELMDLTDFAVIFRYGDIDLDAHIDRGTLFMQVTEVVDHAEEIVREAEHS
jgi:HEPN domain-containing protein